MKLLSIEMKGFKSFAGRTRLDFPTSTTVSTICAIVGPNGSGKSNIADAIKWVLGEQSMKALRGKSAQDVIFAGTTSLARGGLAEVILTFDNSDRKLAIESEECAIARRINREGESGYYINGQKSRLIDIQLLLARAQVGEKSYAVVGQGMIDRILIAEPSQRRLFFEEATGVKEHQIKKDQAVHKLERTRDNLGEARMVLAELEPRVKSLERQVARLKERSTLETQLHQARITYFGSALAHIRTKLSATESEDTTISPDLIRYQEKQATLRAQLAALEHTDTQSDAFLRLQREYQVLQGQKNSAIQNKARLDELIRQERAKSQTPTPHTTPQLPIIEARLTTAFATLEHALSMSTDSLTPEHIASVVEDIRAAHKECKSLLHYIRGEDEHPLKNAEVSPALLAQTEELLLALAHYDENIRTLEAQIRDLAQKEQKDKQEFFALERAIADAGAMIHRLEAERNKHEVARAKLQTEQSALITEYTEEMGPDAAPPSPDIIIPEHELPAVRANMLTLKRKLEWIGGIDEGVEQEYLTAKTRYDFLMGQVTDLEASIQSLTTIISELETLITTQFETALATINTNFQHYFSILFGGGHAGLIKTHVSAEMADTDTDTDEPFEPEDLPGIDIHAAPPGKKVRNIHALSGGEKALTSIALISAIIAQNPSPFVVLDEVDAALDEANTHRFAQILKDLGTKTQLIVITHNRVTMHVADYIFGITLAGTGTSQVLSLNVEEASSIVRQ